jgi:uncharacterized protein (DUF2236 family)
VEISGTPAASRDEASRTSGPAQAGTDLGLFGPGSVTWRVHDEPILMVAGLRALYLQALHPRAVAGVAQNSGYQGDPWGRLSRTITYVATVVYGTTAQARKAGRRVRAIHGKMRAIDPATGLEFRIDEPELLRWVHVTEVESFLSTARRAGARLSPADADRYYLEQRRAAALVGLDPGDVPGSVAEVEEYYAEIRPQLALTTDAASAAVFLSVPPLPFGLGFTPVRGAQMGVSALAIGLLPAWARRMYGLGGLSIADLSATLSARTLRLALRALPDRAVHGPIYRDAMRRAARQSSGASAALLDTADQGSRAGTDAPAGQTRR